MELLQEICMHTQPPIHPTCLSDLCDVTRAAMAQGWEIYFRKIREGLFDISSAPNRQASIMVESVAAAMAATAVRRGCP